MRKKVTVVGAGNVAYDEAALTVYAYDATRLKGIPEVVRVEGR